MRPAGRGTRAHYAGPMQEKESNVPIVLWLLGVPLAMVLLLVLFGVF